MTKTTDGIAFGDELYLPSLAMADQIATDDNKTVQSELNEINQKLSSFKRVCYVAPSSDTSERTVSFSDDCSNVSMFLIQYQYLGIYGCVSSMLVSKGTLVEIKSAGTSNTVATFKYVDGNNCKIKMLDSNYGMHVYAIWMQNK